MFSRTDVLASYEVLANLRIIFSLLAQNDLSFDMWSLQRRFSSKVMPRQVAVVARGMRSVPIKSCCLCWHFLSRQKWTHDDLEGEKINPFFSD